MPMHQNSGAPDVPGRKTIYQRMDVEAPVLREEVLNQPSLKECFLFLFTFFFDYDCAVFAFYFYSPFSSIMIVPFLLFYLYSLFSFLIIVPFFLFFLFTTFFFYDCAVFAFYFYSLFSLIIVLTFALLAYILCSCSYKIQENPYLVGHVEKSIGEGASHHRLLLLQSEHEKHCSIFIKV